jgi:hypothetical protein
MTAGAGGWVLGICVAMAASPWASGQTPRRYTMDREIQFERGTDGARRLLTRTPEAREIVAGPFDIAAEDFNGDGAKEIVLIATSGPMCSDRGCSLVILEKRPGKIVAILSHFLPQSLGVTKEKSGGYFALALLDGNGGIALGEKGTPMAGRQMVFPMEPPQ